MPPPLPTPLKKNIRIALTALTLSTSPFLIHHAQAQAAPAVISGNFVADYDVQTTAFTVTRAESFTFFTTSYAGGTNADGTTIAAGGFDPILTLFDGNGGTVAFNDDDTTGFVTTDPATGLAADSYLTQTLSAGTYTLAISEYDNFAPADISDYSEAGNPTFTSEFSNPFDPLPGPFLDQTGAQRTSAYTYDIVPGPLAAPEISPGAALTALFALLGGAVARRRQVARPA